MSGILYPILILTLFLIVQILTMMASRKAVLDKNKQQLLDSVNASNKIYSNEELSILVSDLQTKVNTLEAENHILRSENDELLLNKKEGQRSFWLRKDMTKENTNPTTLVIDNIDSMVLIEIKMYGSYGWINYGGFVEYKLGGLLESNTIYGIGEDIVKKGLLGDSIGAIVPRYANGTTLTFDIPFTKVSSTSGRGSTVVFEVIVHGLPTQIKNTTAVIN